MSRTEESREIKRLTAPEDWQCRQSDWMELVDDRLSKLESSVGRVENSTSSVVEAFTAAQGAFKVLEWLGKLAKPLLWLGGLATVGLAVAKNLSHSQNSIIRSIFEQFK